MARSVHDLAYILCRINAKCWDAHGFFELHPVTSIEMTVPELERKNNGDFPSLEFWMDTKQWQVAAHLRRDREREIDRKR